MITCNSLIFILMPLFLQNTYGQSDSLKKISIPQKNAWFIHPPLDSHLILVKEINMQNSLIGKTGPEIVKPTINHVYIQIEDKKYIVDSLQISKLKFTWVKSVKLPDTSKGSDTALIILKKRFVTEAKFKLDIK